jgi:glutathione S-transferase
MTMLKLYYGPGACSLASHITLEEIGAPYESQSVALAKGEQRTDAYLKVNPRAKVPALALGDGSVLTENVAILTYLAKSHPDKRLMPSDALGEARCLSMMAWFSNTVHPSFTHVVRPERFAEGEAAQATVKEVGRKTFWTNLAEIDRLLGDKTWMRGEAFSVCDPYALVFYGWGVRAELPMRELAGYTRWKERMLARPAVRKILEREDSILLKAA